MKTTIKFFDMEITLSGLKAECEAMKQAFDKLSGIRAYQRTYSGIKKEGVEPEGTTFWVMFGQNKLREEETFKAKIEDFKKRIPAIVTLYDVKANLLPEMNQLFKDHVCIVDNRVTEEEEAERQKQIQEQEQRRKEQSNKIQELINLKGEGEVTREVNEMFLTICAYFNDSYSMSDYFHPHHSIGNAYAIGRVPKGARKESLVRDTLSSIPELQQFTWDWHTEEYSMGHGTFMESSEVGIAPIKAYDGRTEVGYWYEIHFSNSLTLPKSRLYVEPSARKSVSVTGAQPAGDKIATCKLNADKGGIELYFPGKPSPTVLDDLKANGWRWSRFNSCWYKLDNSIARRVAAKYAAIPEEQEVNNDGALVQAQEEAVFDTFSANNL